MGRSKYSQCLSKIKSRHGIVTPAVFARILKVIGRVRINGTIKRNLITNKGKIELAKALARKSTFKPYQVWATDNATAPAITDTTADFADMGSGDACEPAKIINDYLAGNENIYVAIFGVATGNFHQLKLGLVTKNRVLIAEVTVDYTKAAGDAERIEWGLEVQ